MKKDLLTKGSIQEENISFVNIYSLNKVVPNYIK